MLRYIFALKKSLKPHIKNSLEIIVIENKAVPHMQKFSTEPKDERILNHVNLLNRKEFKNISPNEWLDRINVMRIHRFLDSDSLDMIKRHPEILQIPLRNFESSMKQWSCSNLDMDDLQAIIFRNPVLLEVEHFVIRKRLPYLKMICGPSDVLSQLLMNSPNVMLDNWIVVLEKFNYLLKVRGFKIRDVVQSFALCRSLDFIKFRFDLLEKCGIYKQMTLHIHKINKFDKSQHRNPSLKQILILDDEYFSSMVAKISVEEYNVCYDLFMTEEEADSDDEQESDISDSDSDSNRNSDSDSDNENESNNKKVGRKN